MIKASNYISIQNGRVLWHTHAHFCGRWIYGGRLKPSFNLSKSHISLKHVKRIQQRGGRFQSTLKRWYSDAVVEFSVKCATTTELPFLLSASDEGERKRVEQLSSA